MGIDMQSMDSSARYGIYNTTTIVSKRCEQYEWISKSHKVKVRNVGRLITRIHVHETDQGGKSRYCKYRVSGKYIKVVALLWCPSCSNDSIEHQATLTTMPTAAT